MDKKTAPKKTVIATAPRQSRTKTVASEIVNNSVPAQPSKIEQLEGKVYGLELQVTMLQSRLAELETKKQPSVTAIPQSVASALPRDISWGPASDPGNKPTFD